MKKALKVVLIVLLSVVVLLALLVGGVYFYIKSVNYDEYYNSDNPTYEYVSFIKFNTFNEDQTKLIFDIPSEFLTYNYFNLDKLNKNYSDYGITIEKVGIYEDEQKGKVDVYTLAKYDGKISIEIPLKLVYEYSFDNTCAKFTFTNVEIGDKINLSSSTISKLLKQDVNKQLDVSQNYSQVYENMIVDTQFIEDARFDKNNLHIVYRLYDASYHFVVDQKMNIDVDSSILDTISSEKYFPIFYELIKEYFRLWRR